MALAEASLALAAKQLAVSPAHVAVGPDLRHGVGATLRAHADAAVIVAGRQAWANVAGDVAASLEAADVRWRLSLCEPDCTEAAAAAALAAGRSTEAGAVLGVGGGKALDLAKLTGHLAGWPVVTLPTSAATCAAWTALGNFYTETGAFHRGQPLASCQAAAVVDTALIARAPARLLASGLADTMAKWIETSASVRYEAADLGTRAAWTMARFLYDEIRAWGREAYADASAGRLTPTLARAIEANICLAGTVGGLGGERCRSVAAHAVCNALTTMPGTPLSWHGEKVAFGMIAQLLLEGRDDDAADLAAFFHALDLPLTLEALGYRLEPGEFAAVAAHVCRGESTAHHLPHPVTPERVLAALITADALGASL